MKKPILFFVLAILCAILISGCTFARQKINVENFIEKVQAVKAGETNVDDLPGILGSLPNAVVPLPEGKRVYIYTFGDGKTKGLNLLILQINRTNFGLDSGYFFCNADGLITEVIVSNHSKNVHWDWWAFGE